MEPRLLIIDRAIANWDAALSSPLFRGSKGSATSIIGDRDAGVRHEFAGQFCGQRQALMQPPGNRRRRLASPRSMAARNMPNSGPRIAFSASTTPVPSSSKIRSMSPSRASTFVASAARISGVRVLAAVSPCRVRRDLEPCRNQPPADPRCNRQVDVRPLRA